MADQQAELEAALAQLTPQQQQQFAAIQVRRSLNVQFPLKIDFEMAI
jgi:hypothetical protein